MEQRRLFGFMMISLVIGMAWFNFAVPVLFPDLVARKKPPVATREFKELLELPAADALRPVNVVVQDPAKPVKAEIVNHPKIDVFLGPADPDLAQDAVLKEKLDEFFLAANLTNQGAAINYIELTDKQRYPSFAQRGNRVRVVGNNPLATQKTFSLLSPEIDSQLDGTSLDRVTWEYVLEDEAAKAERAATFRFVSPDGRWEVRKRFELKQLNLEELKQPRVRETFAEGFEIKLTITIKILSTKTRDFHYTLQGPVGVPLEDPENSSRYREARMGFLRDDGKNVDESKLAAAEVVKKNKNNSIPEWKRKLKYIGVDVLYFAALILPGPDQIEMSKAVIARENVDKPHFSDISVELNSSPIEVAANQEVTHEYKLYAGPKRKELVEAIPAAAVMDSGWTDSICRGMGWLLNLFHRLGLSYGVAIMCLTALVRILMMPISKHQAANAEKMKELQPKILAKQKELEAKYGKNSDEYLRQSQELGKEQIGMMMSGCLPVFLQLPIFMALYHTIGTSIELRMEPFLWFENLAAPDSLFAFPFVVPWMGWTHFNLLPCISAGLMFVQQKMTMPPPQNEEQAQQQKMMNFMMIFMAAMFYRVPSGLCIYFIATNIWSLTERWLFKRGQRHLPPSELVLGTVQPTPVAPISPVVPKKEDSKPSALGSLWERLQQTADNQYDASRQLNRDAAGRAKKKKKK